MTRRSWRRARVAHAGDRLQQRRDRLQARIPRIPQRESDIVPAGYTLFLTAWQSIVPDRTGTAVAAAQHLFMVATLFALQRMARAIMSADLASLGFLVAGSVAPTLFLPQTSSRRTSRSTAWRARCGSRRSLRRVARYGGISAPGCSCRLRR